MMTPVILVFFLQFLCLAARNLDFIASTQCRSICGFRNGAESGIQQRNLRLSDKYPFDHHYPSEICEDKQSVRSWEKSAKLFMKYIGLNDRSLPCSTSKFSRKPNSELIGFSSMYHHIAFPISDNVGDFKDYLISQSTRSIYVEEPRNIPGKCSVSVQRGISFFNASQSSTSTFWIPSYILSQGNPPITKFSVFALVNVSSGLVHSVRAPRNNNDSCTGISCNAFQLLSLSTSTFNTSVPFQLDKEGVRTYDSTELFSMFTKMDLEDITGMPDLLDEMEVTARDKENLDNELSISNLAILSLPLVMGIPPISLIDGATDAITVWYAIATDVLAAGPLFIKGIELILTNRRSALDLYSSRGMVGTEMFPMVRNRYGIFEQWEVHCKIPPGKIDELGYILVGIVLWVVASSLYVEYIFWRKMRIRQGKLQTIENLIPADNSFDADNEGVKTATRNCNIHQVFKAQLWISFMIPMILLCSGKFSDDITVKQLLNVLISVLITILQTMSNERIHQFKQLDFYRGIPLGPVCLVLHLRPAIRKSERWNDLGHGGSVGFGILAMVVAMILDLKGMHLTFVQFEIAVVFASVLFLASLSLHIIRHNTQQDRALMWYGIHGFALGFFFGVFSNLFSCCFPELQGRVKKVRPRFQGGRAWGIVFSVLTFLFLLKLLTREKTKS